jgi:hypothetical protein
MRSDALRLLGAVYLNIFSYKQVDAEAAKRFSVEFWKPKAVGSRS